MLHGGEAHLAAAGVVCVWVLLDNEPLPCHCFLVVNHASVEQDQAFFVNNDEFIAIVLDNTISRIFVKKFPLDFFTYWSSCCTSVPCSNSYVKPSHPSMDILGFVARDLTSSFDGESQKFAFRDQIILDFLKASVIYLPRGTDRLFEHPLLGPVRSQIARNWNSA